MIVHGISTDNLKVREMSNIPARAYSLQSHRDLLSRKNSGSSE